jgi:flagellum-specific peptidoglycan hydrolase FlgJ
MNGVRVLLSGTSHGVHGLTDDEVIDTLAQDLVSGVFLVKKQPSVGQAQNPGIAHAPSYVAAFIKMALPSATNVRSKWGVPIAVTIGQSALESGWGRSVVGNAYFGVKGTSASGSSVTFPTKESVGGKMINTQGTFRAFANYAEAADDYGRTLATLSRYKPAFAYKNDPIMFARMIARAHYATDPNYEQELVSTIKAYKLTFYDQPTSS